MHFLSSLAVLATLATFTGAQNAPVAPTLDLLSTLTLRLGASFDLGGAVPFGNTVDVIPVVGGTFNGSRLSGEVLNLGADYRLTDRAGIIRPDAHLSLRTDDGANVYLQLEGAVQPDGRGLIHIKFQTATDGSYSWLNIVKAVGVSTTQGTGSVPDVVVIEVWNVTPA
ncbi:hypothetical protein B0J13DRAFT_194784 [Dactylonectria estremocensis]|uniref:Uncharacterized protein n=1 Tax=Dactylonectria estremocensis TaxID=1079267 RepID=A0A9P9DIB1_9HYPO|nr:hypothetical protein B0J13DRAFT_194784 [Dactylonectria estremocensis]